MVTLVWTRRNDLHAIQIISNTNYVYTVLDATNVQSLLQPFRGGDRGRFLSDALDLVSARSSSWHA